MKGTGNNEALATQEKEQAALAVPNYLKDQVGNRAGSEGVDRDDLLVPRLGIAQALSPQLKKSNEAHIPGLEVGQLFNSVTNEVYGTEVTVVPLFFFKNYITFKPIEEGGGIIAMYESRDEVPEGGLNFNNGSKPTVTEFKSRMCLLLQPGKTPEPIVVSFKSSGLKTARKWNSLITMLDLPAYARAYKLTAVTRSKGSQEWEGLDVLPLEFVPEAFFKQAETYFKTLQGAGVTIDTTGISDEREAGSDDGAPAF